MDYSILGKRGLSIDTVMATSDIHHTFMIPPYLLDYVRCESGIIDHQVTCCTSDYMQLHIGNLMCVSVCMNCMWCF